MKHAIFTALLLAAASAKGQTLDKVSHFAVGGTIAGFGYSVTHKITHSRWAPPAVGMTLAVTAAVGKEIRDRRLYNSPTRESIKDIAYTSIGAGLACITLKICF